MCLRALATSLASEHWMPPTELLSLGTIDMPRCAPITALFQCTAARTMPTFFSRVASVHTYLLPMPQCTHQNCSTKKHMILDASA